MAGGTYYFDPRAGVLMQLVAGAEVSDDVHVPYNQSAAAECAFTLFLVAAMDGIRPLYGDLSEQLVLSEGALMCQLLDLTGPSLGVGLCQIGTCAFDRVRDLFALDTQHRLVQTILGGGLPGWVYTPAGAGAGEEREHGTL